MLFFFLWNMFHKRTDQYGVDALNCIKITWLIETTLQFITIPVDA